VVSILFYFMIVFVFMHSYFYFSSFFYFAMEGVNLLLTCSLWILFVFTRHLSSYSVRVRWWWRWRWL